MSQSSQLCGLIVVGESPATRQWITLPESGDPSTPNEFTLTGPNGTGKSSLLQDLTRHLKTQLNPDTSSINSDSPEQLIITSHDCSGDRYHFITAHFSDAEPCSRILTDSAALQEQLSAWADNIPGTGAMLSRLFHSDFSGVTKESLPAPLPSPLLFTADGKQTGTALPALTKQLHSHFARRRDQFLLFLSEESSQQKMVGDVIAEFRENSPNHLEELATLWNDAIEADSGVTFNPDTATFSFRKPGPPAAFQSLSAPLQRFLSVTGSLFLSPAETASLVLIDEPELGLSDNLSGRFMRILRDHCAKSGRQLIVATKSSAIESSSPRSGVIQLSLDEGGVRTAATLPEESDGVEVTQPAGRITHPSHVSLAKLKRAIEETDDQDELANLVDELVSLRKL